MSNLDDQLNRLLRAGSKAKAFPASEMPFGFATRVLAEWRGSGDEAQVSSARICARALLCSFGAALLSILLNIQPLESFRQLDAWHAADLRLIDSTLQTQMP